MRSWSTFAGLNLYPSLTKKLFPRIFRRGIINSRNVTALVGTPVLILSWYCIGTVSPRHPDRTTAILVLDLYVYKEATWFRRPIIIQYTTPLLSQQQLSHQIPLPCSNTHTTKQIRLAVLLAILAREIDEHIFQPIYIAPGDFRIRKVLADLAATDSEKESFCSGPSMRKLR